MPLRAEFLQESIFGPFLSLTISTNICDVELWDSVTRILGRIESLSNNDREGSENAVLEKKIRALSKFITSIPLRSAYRTLSNYARIE